MGAIYFSHDEDARNDPKIAKLRAKYGMEGYGCFFASLEMFSMESSHSLPYSQDQFDAMAYEFRCSFQCKEFVDKCIEIGLFSTDGERFWSEAFNRRIEEKKQRAKKRSDSARVGAEARWNAKREARAKKVQKQSEDILSLEGQDENWRKFVNYYESNLGFIPCGGSSSEKALEDYYEELGLEVMQKAVDVTAAAHVEGSPERYLLAVLKSWESKGVDTPEKADAATAEHKRKVEGWRSKQRVSSQNAESEWREIPGKFW